jgi:hypothetical protein
MPTPKLFRRRVPKKSGDAGIDVSNPSTVKGAYENL